MKGTWNLAGSLVLAVFVLCVPATNCFATVEPELTSAIRHKDFQHVQTLLSEGVDVNERDEGAEQTPLMWAVRTGNLSLVENLLNHGATVNAQDDFGHTALTFSVKRGYTRITQLLMSRGAKLTVWNRKHTVQRSVVTLTRH